MPLADAAVFAGRLADEAGCRRLREEGADADQHHAGQHVGKVRGQHQRQADGRDRQRAPDRRPRSEPRDGAPGQQAS